MLHKFLLVLGWKYFVVIVCHISIKQLIIIILYTPVTLFFRIVKANLAMIDAVCHRILCGRVFLAD